MNKQLIKKDGISIWNKIKLFIKKIFSKKKKQEDVSPIIEEKNVITKTNLEERLKVNTYEIYGKEKELNEFIKEIEDTPSILEKISEDRLDKLIAYYEKITKEKDEKIKKLKTALN